MYKEGENINVYRVGNMQTKFSGNHKSDTIPSDTTVSVRI